MRYLRPRPRITYMPNFRYRVYRPYFVDMNGDLCLCYQETGESPTPVPIPEPIPEPIPPIEPVPPEPIP